MNEERCDRGPHSAAFDIDRLGQGIESPLELSSLSADRTANATIAVILRRTPFAPIKHNKRVVPVIELQSGNSVQTDKPRKPNSRRRH